MMLGTCVQNLSSFRVILDVEIITLVKETTNDDNYHINFVKILVYHSLSNFRIQTVRMLNWFYTNFRKKNRLTIAKSLISMQL